MGIDAWDMQNIANPVAHLNAKPSDGTVVEGLPSKTYWSFASGYRSPAAANSAAVPVDDVGLAAFPAVDTVAPATTVAGLPSGWVNHAVTLTFSAKDNTGGSGVSYTEYALNGGTWTHGTSVTVSAAGTSTVSHRSADNAGNLEAAKSCGVRIDTAAPAAKVKALSVTAAHAKRDEDGSWFRVTISDPAPSCGCASLRIVLTTAKGKKLITRTFKFGDAPTRR